MSSHKSCGYLKLVNIGYPLDIKKKTRRVVKYYVFLFRNPLAVSFPMKTT